MRPIDDVAVLGFVVGSAALAVGWVLLRLVGRRQLGSWFEYAAAVVFMGSVVVGAVAYYSDPGPKAICVPQAPPPLQKCAPDPASTT